MAFRNFLINMYDKLSVAGASDCDSSVHSTQFGSSVKNRPSERHHHFRKPHSSKSKSHHHHKPGRMMDLPLPKEQDSYSDLELVNYGSMRQFAFVGYDGINNSEKKKQRGQRLQGSVSAGNHILTANQAVKQAPPAVGRKKSENVLLKRLKNFDKSKKLKDTIVAQRLRPCCASPGCSRHQQQGAGDLVPSSLKEQQASATPAAVKPRASNKPLHYHVIYRCIKCQRDYFTKKGANEHYARKHAKKASSSTSRKNLRSARDQA